MTLSLGMRPFSDFESAMVRLIVWQLKGHHLNEVPLSATRRMIRASLESKRIKAPCIGRSARLADGDKGELDHVVPRNVIVDMLLKLPEPTEQAVKEVLAEYLVCAELTRDEHREYLKPWTKRMPDGWTAPGDRLARYSKANIRLRS